MDLLMDLMGGYVYVLNGRICSHAQLMDLFTDSMDEYVHGLNI